MSNIVSSRPIFPIFFRLFFGALVVVFLFTLRTSMRPDEYGRWEMGTRIFIPFCAVLCYLLLLMAVNSRKVLVTPRGVQVRFGPLPGFTSHSILRGDIWLCFIRQIVNTEDGHVVESFWATGVETAKGQQVLVSYPIDSSERALEQARRLAAILNQDQAHSPVEVRPPSQSSGRDLARLKIIGIWFALTMLAIFGGAAWEISAT